MIDKVIGIETSGETCAIAVSNGGTIRTSVEVAPQRHNEVLLPKLETLLEEAALAIADAELVAFGHGPGAFTGVRLAASVAQGLAMPHQVPVAGVSTLAVIAEGAVRRGLGSYIAVATDARRQQIYCGLYAKGGQGVTPYSPDCLLDPEKFKLPHTHQWQLVGNGWDRYRDRFQIDTQTLHTAIDAVPDATDVITLGIAAHRHGQSSQAEFAAPIYLRDP
ncbi:MAG: tRNA (adenosine(37)-N6)-threonylcarbamoyltransferase complex dimerization subunit type 1 TsaB [Pseudomonadota bacterium]